MAKFKSLNYYTVLIIASLLYVVLTLTAPIDPASATRYNLSDVATRLLQLTIVLPVIAIWTAAFFGAIRFKKYAHTIAASPDGTALNRVSNGLMALAVGLVVATLFGALQSWVRGTDLVIPFRIVNRYIGVAYPLLAFWLTYQGSAQLRKLVKKPRPATRAWTIGGLIVAAVAVFYVKSLFSLPVRNSMDPTQTNSLFLPDSLILLTVVVPTVTTWLLGLASAINLSTYQKNVSGVLYKEALSRLAKGVLLIIVFSIGISLLVALSEFFQQAGLAVILIIIYLIIAIWAIGYLIIASGAKKLTKIETV